jgi:hypothetical protein
VDQTRTSLSPDDRDRYRVGRARAVARLMRRLGWVSLAVGVLGLVGIVVLLALGEMDAEEALLAATGTALVTMVSGAATYGSGMNLTLSASRLERDIARSKS